VISVAEPMVATILVADRRQNRVGRSGGQMLSGNYHPVLPCALGQQRTDGAQPLPSPGPCKRARYPQVGAILFIPPWAVR